MQITSTVSTLLLAVTLVLSVDTANAQAKDEKALKAELKTYKKMSPEQIKAIKDNLDRKSEELRKAEANASMVKAQMREMQAAQSSNDSLLNVAQAENARLQNDLELARSEAQASQLAASTPVTNKSTKMKGTSFGVQIGAFNGYTMPKEALNSGVREETENGMKKYVVGTYASRNQAEALKTSLIEMGVKDAFVVTYRNGVRVAVN